MQRLILFATTLALCTVTASIAFASSGEHGLPWANFIYRIITIVLFIGVLAYFFGKKIKAFFVGRTEGIAAQIADLEARKAEAQQNLRHVEVRISNLDAECAAVLAEYRRQGEALQATIVAQAEKKAAQITAQAKQAAQNEVNHAIDLLREEMAEKIVEATEKLLTKQLTAEEHTKLVDKYLTKVVLN